MSAALTLTFPNCISAPGGPLQGDQAGTTYAEKQSGTGDGQSTFTALFVGKLDYQHNYESLARFIDNMWDRFSRLRPDPLLRICGLGCPENPVSTWRLHPHIDYRGYVDSIEEVYEGVDVSICPAEVGSGTHIKIIESLIRRVTAVIIVKPHRGYEDTLLDGESLFAVREEREFVERLWTLADDSVLRHKMGENGYGKTHENYTYESIQERLGEMVRGLARP